MRLLFLPFKQLNNDVFQKFFSAKVNTNKIPVAIPVDNKCIGLFEKL